MSLFASSNKVWLTWHFATRSRNLAKVLNLELYEYYENKSLIKRHLFSSLWTIKILVQKRPKIIFIQLSFLLLVLVVIYKILTFGKVVIVADCHTKALRRKAEGFLNFIFWPMKKATFKFIDLAIVSNDGMIKNIKELNENYMILPDKIPNINVKQDIKITNDKYCVYVSAFAVDEPFDELFEVAELIGNEIKLYWTGKIPKHYKLPDYVPSNIIFTGYVSFDQYFKLISNANCILALTTEQDCLQSGAYEALSVNVPMVISDTKALKDYFSKSAFYTNHDPQNIAKNILLAIENCEIQKKYIIEIKNVRNQEFDEKIEKLKVLLS